MKIVKVLGGLGNQMFQYALYIALKENFPNEQVYIDISAYNGYALHNGFELKTVFSIPLNQAPCKAIASAGYYLPHYRLWQVGKFLLPKKKGMCVEKSNLSFDHTIFHNSQYQYFDGYWQNERYFKHCAKQIRKIFTFPPFTEQKNLQLAKQIQCNISTSIHIRRGDYLNNHLYNGICGLEYYKEAISLIEKLTTTTLYCVFSDDIPWCKQHIEPYIKKAIIYVNWNTKGQSFRDMQLMSLCTHNIIANSSFSWWSAWLNQHTEKIIIAPKEWIHIKDCQFELPDRWLRL